MAIGTSLGAYFDDEFHHAAGINTDPSADNNVIDPDLDSGAGVKPKPKLDIMPVSDRLYVSPLKQDESASEDDPAMSSETYVNPLAKGLVAGVGDMLKEVATLPQRAIENSQTALDTGNYNPAPVIEAAQLGLTPPVGKLSGSLKEAMGASNTSKSEINETVQNTVRDTQTEYHGPSPLQSLTRDRRALTPEAMTDEEFYVHGLNHEPGAMTPAQEERWSRVDRELAINDRARLTYEDMNTHEQTPFRPDNLHGETLEETLARLDRQDAERNARLANNAAWEDYGKVKVADRGYGSFLFKTEDSKVLSLSVHERNNGKTLYVSGIGDMIDWNKNTMGKSAMRGLFKALADKYPNAEKISGFRVSGARKVTGSGSAVATMKIPGRGKNPERKTIEQLSRELDED